MWNASVRAGIAAKATAACEEIRPHRHNLIGYIWTDTPAFDVGYAQAQRGTDWVTAMRCLPADAPGRQAYMAWLKERFAANITRVCSAYSVPRAACAATATWEHLDLCRYKNTATPAMMADDAAFARLMSPQRCADEIDADYGTCKASYLCAMLEPEPPPYAACLKRVRAQAATPPAGWVPAVKRQP